jgi:hypothetical protein
MDEAVRRYQELVDEGYMRAVAAATVATEFDVTLAQLHDALVARGLLKSYGA